MKDASYLLKLVRRCRYLEKTGIEPEIIEQLRIWATELAEIAEDSESRAVQPEMAFKLDAVGAVVDPGSARLDELAGRDHRGMANDGDEIALAAGFDAQNAEAVVGVVEGHPVD
jgi:hypothetical protein